MTKFKIGDRVRRVGESVYVPIGSEGIVCATLTNNIEVQWDWTAFVGAYDLNQQTKWLALVDPGGVITVPAAIDQYTAACQAFEAAQLAFEKAKAAVEDARNDLRDVLDGEA